MIKIWGRATSSNVAKVMWAVAELGLPHQRIDIGGPFGGTRDPAYLQLNPTAQIPTIEDDGFMLWESNAIVRYLSAKYGAGRLWPPDERRQASADRWMDWASTSVAPSMDALRAAYRKPAEQQDAAATAAALASAGDVWHILESVLRQHPFTEGDDLTAADIGLGVLVHRWHLVPLPRLVLPAVAAWHDRLKARPAYVTHVVTIVR